MNLYVLTVGGLNFAVNFLLLAGTNRICGYPADGKRSCAGAVLSGAYAGWCLIPGFCFLGNGLWHTVFLLLVSLLAFGMDKDALRRSAVYLLLNLILTGVALDQKSAAVSLLGAAGLVVICLIGVSGRGGGFVPVELSYEGKTLYLTALRDSGNTLTDPITGSPVLVVGAEVAGQLAGLTPAQLKNPVESMTAIPGLRLIPYRTVGSTGSMLLGMRLKQIRIGKWKGSGLVAFAPERLCETGRYQALTGGCL